MNNLKLFFNFSALILVKNRLLFFYIYYFFQNKFLKCNRNICQNKYKIKFRYYEF